MDVDEASAAFYRQLPGALGDRLRQVLHTAEGSTTITIEDGRCPMWQQDGLCRIQAELGHDALCQVCRAFPRLRHDYGDFVELGLELSCPEAARLILTSPHQELITEDLPGGEVPDYDACQMATLQKSRSAVFSLLNSGLSVPQKLQCLLLYAHRVQQELDGDIPAELDIPAALTLAEEIAENGDMTSVFAFFQDLEILTQVWKTRLDAGVQAVGWQPETVNLARYGVLRYWYQTISDGDLVGRAKLIILSCLTVNAMGGSFLETAQLFSKEIENDPDNIDALLDGAYYSPALTDAKLLGLLK